MWTPANRYDSHRYSWDLGLEKLHNNEEDWNIREEEFCVNNMIQYLCVALVAD